MAEDWLSDVQKYDPDADPDVVAGIVRYCGIALRKRDSALVSFSSDDEVARVRNNFLKKKLGLEQPDDELNVAINAVGERMNGDNSKNRVTVYYLLSQAFDRHDAFRKAPRAKAAPKGDDVVAAVPAAEPSAPEAPATQVEDAPSEAPSISDTSSSPAFAADAPRTVPPEPVAPTSFGRKVSNGVPPPPPNPIRSTLAETSSVPLVEEEKSGGFRWWPWLILVVVAIAAFLWWQNR